MMIFRSVLMVTFGLQLRAMSKTSKWQTGGGQAARQWVRLHSQSNGASNDLARTVHGSAASSESFRTPSESFIEFIVSAASAANFSGSE